MHVTYNCVHVLGMLIVSLDSSWLFILTFIIQLQLR